MDTDNHHTQPTVLHDTHVPEEAAAPVGANVQAQTAAAVERLAFGKVSAVFVAVFGLFSYPYRAIKQLFDKHEKPVPAPATEVQAPEKPIELPAITIVAGEGVAAFSSTEREAVLSAARKALLELDITSTSAH